MYQNVSNHCEIDQSVQKLANYCLEHGYKIATAESCTGGWISHAIVSMPGSSGWFEGGMVTYSNDAKSNWLHIPMAMIDEHGAVSEAVARAMVQGVLSASKATHAVSVTGIAGPTGGTSEKPVGLVWFAWGDDQGHLLTQQIVFKGDRASVRAQAVLLALNGFFNLFKK